MKLSIPLIYLSLLFLASCQQNNSHNKGLESSVENSEIQQDNTFCNEHNKDCGKFAMDLNMSLDDYHKWEKEQLDAIAQEDAMTDANGDIVDPNAPSIESSRGTQKQWINCEYCHGNGTNECWVCNGVGNERCKRCDGKGTLKYWGQDGSETCDNCGGRGNNNCRKCNGKGIDGNCRHCNGRGQVLVAN